MDHRPARFDEPEPKFPFGQIVATKNVITQIHHEEFMSALSRHLQGDWGTLDAEDRRANDRALENGGRLFSQYYSTKNIKFWIITEADRSVTTMLLPEDY